MPSLPGCPCGAHVTDPDGLVVWVTEAILDEVVEALSLSGKWGALLAPMVNQMVNVEAICSSPKPVMPNFSIADFPYAPGTLVKVAQAIHVKLYELLCSCNTCPPVVDCLGGTCYTVTPDDGYWADFPYTKRYRLEHGHYWIVRPDGHCQGEVTDGLTIQWIVDPSYDASLGVDIEPYLGGANSGWSGAVFGQGVSICVDGTPTPPIVPWPPTPAGLPDYYGPPTCTTSDICAALDYVYQVVRRIEFLTGVTAGPTYGVTADYNFTLPGLNTPIVGPLVSSLPRALAALGAISPGQLVDPEVVPIVESSLVDLDNHAYCSIELTAVPATMSVRGTSNAQVYFQKTNANNPGWVVVVGQEGVIDYHGLNYPIGTEFALPPTATGLAVNIAPGVEIAITLSKRHV